MNFGLCELKKKTKQKKKNNKYLNKNNNNSPVGKNFLSRTMVHGVVRNASHPTYIPHRTSDSPLEPDWPYYTAKRHLEN